MDDEDKLEGDVVGRRARRLPDPGSAFRPTSAANSKPVAKRASAAWYNRSRGAGVVKLKHERPVGSHRVVVKIHSKVHAKLAGGARSLMTQALYVERDGAGREGGAVQVFDREHDRADGAAFVDRCLDDRRHFRVMISPEFGEAIHDLKTYTRNLMRIVESDLDTRIDWIAAEHHDTGRAHVHLLMRGVRADGRDLIIPRSYFFVGFRKRAEGLATELLGPRLEPERHRDRVKQERLTDLDRELIARARDREIAMSALADGIRAARLVQRLNRLEELGLAELASPGVWRLDANLEDRLIRLGDRRDRERAAARLLAQQQRGREPERTRELEAAHSSQRVVGRLVGFERMGIYLRGPQLIGVEGVDGKFWTARVAGLEDLRGLAGVERGAIVEIERAKPGMKTSDRTIWEIAQQNNLTYSADLHRQSRPGDRALYIEMHERRLEALGRDGVVKRGPDGAFYLPHDYPAQVARHEARGGRENARVTLIDPHALERQATYPGPAWLDRVADGRAEIGQMRTEGFGVELASAWKRREQTLEELGLGERRPDGFHAAPGWRDSLALLEETSLRDRIERDTGRVAHFARDGERVHGLYTERIHLAEQSLALIEQDLTATLAPWRPAMDRALNQLVAGQVTGGKFDFSVGADARKEIAKMIGLDIGGRG